MRLRNSSRNRTMMRITTISSKMMKSGLRESNPTKRRKRRNSENSNNRKVVKNNSGISRSNSHKMTRDKDNSIIDKINKVVEDSSSTFQSSNLKEVKDKRMRNRVSQEDKVDIIPVEVEVVMIGEDIVEVEEVRVVEEAVAIGMTIKERSKIGITTTRVAIL